MVDTTVVTITIHLHAPMVTGTMDHHPTTHVAMDLHHTTTTTVRVTTMLRHSDEDHLSTTMDITGQEMTTTMGDLIMIIANIKDFCQPAV